MPRFVVSGLLAFLVSLPARAAGGPAEGFVALAAIDFSVRQQMKIPEPEATCLLKREVAQALSRAQAAVKLSGHSLKVYDCYRPTWASKKIHQPDPDPHATGGAVDVTLVDRTGNDVAMPSAYDEAGKSDVAPDASSPRLARRNAKRLADALLKEGFVAPAPERWWHFVYRDAASWPARDFPYAAVKTEPRK